METLLTTDKIEEKINDYGEKNKQKKTIKLYKNRSGY